MQKSRCITIISSILLCSSLLYTSCFAEENNKAQNNVSQKHSVVTTKTEEKNPSKTSSMEENIDKKIHDYIIKNPNVIIESIQNLQKQKAQEEQEKTAAIKEKAVKNKDSVFNAKIGGHITIGATNPKVIVTEVFGYQCPVCRATSPAITTILQNNNDIQFIFIPWTFEGKADVYAGQAMIALNQIDPTKFLAIHKELLNLDGILQVEQIDKIMEKHGIDIAKLKQIIKSQENIKKIKNNFELAKTLDLFGTPTIFITNADKTKIEVIPGQASAEDLQNIINEVK